METYVFPSIGDRPIADVEAREILGVLTPIWFARAETARRVLQRMEAVFKSAILRGYRERVSPCVGVKEELGARRQEDTKHRALQYRLIPGFLTQLRVSRCYLTTKLALDDLVHVRDSNLSTQIVTWSDTDGRCRCYCPWTTL